eukprot:m.222005 g.222005  ORF g.222005 m.222005 type:complete len:460 (+) comp18730_c0_seq5:298-1677(+)
MPFGLGKKNSAKAPELEPWVKDSIVTFLGSPLYATPVFNFIDQQCVVFGPEEENPLSSMDIFQQYADLVESALDAFLADIGLDVEQLVAVLDTLKEGEVAEDVLRTIPAASDFLAFKDIMVKKNIELENLVRANMEAMPMEERASTEPISPPTSQKPDELDSALSSSLSEFQLQQQLAESKEKQELDAALAASQQEHERELQRQRAEARDLEEALRLSLATASQNTSATPSSSATPQSASKTNQSPTRVIAPPDKLPPVGRATGQTVGGEIESSVDPVPPPPTSTSTSSSTSLAGAPPLDKGVSAAAQQEQSEPTAPSTEVVNVAPAPEQKGQSVVMRPGGGAAGGLKPRPPASRHPGKATAAHVEERQRHFEQLREKLLASRAQQRGARLKQFQDKTAGLAGAQASGAQASGAQASGAKSQELVGGGASNGSGEKPNSKGAEQGAGRRVQIRSEVLKQ